MSHDFSKPYSFYPAVIAQMDSTFTSHEFILRLAQQHQVEYIEALHAYRNTLRASKPAPFLIVHGVLALHLQDCKKLVKQSPGYVDSVDIFGDEATCAEWRKV